jgi:hypothetical protein
MTGAANKTAGSIIAQDTTQEISQLFKNRPLPQREILAIAAAIKLVRPA